MDEREKKSVVRRRDRGSGDFGRRSGKDDQMPTGTLPSSGPRRRRSRRARRQKRNAILKYFLLIVLVVAAAAGFVFWQKYGSSKEEADLGQYYELQSENDLAVVIDGQVVRRSAETEEQSEPPAPGKIYDGQYYVEYSVVHNRMNKRFYWDSNENLLLYTLPGGSVSVGVGSREYTEINEKKNVDYVILKTEGKTAYIALPFIQAYTNMEYSVYNDPVNRVAVTTQWGEKETAVIKWDTYVRYRGGVKSPVLCKVEKSDSVTILEQEDNWLKVCTKDGFVGYIKERSVKERRIENVTREFKEPVYTNISKDYTINMAWHNVTNATANGYVLSMIAKTKGLTTLAPTWFSVADLSGSINSLADADYVNYAHQSGIEVWGVLRDFHGGINSYDETYQLLSRTSSRNKLINQVVAAALSYDLDGINLDFELVSSACGEHYIQFVRELSVKCRQNGLIFSVDNYVPQPYNQHYDLEEQGEVADYVIIMAYDEHTDGSYEAGSVASISYLTDGVANALELVPKTKLMAGIPFFTRLWHEKPKTEEELASQEGTEAGTYLNKVTSKAYSMDGALAQVKEAGVQASWDDTTKQNYAQWEGDGGTYKIWLEDLQSLEEKLKVIKSNDLAGVAQWSLGREMQGTWDLILQYVN